MPEWFSAASALASRRIVRGVRGRCRTPRQHLERDIAAQSRVPSPIHLAHAALAKFLDDKKRAEA